jgi:SAM-dependent methyltransferase
MAKIAEWRKAQIGEKQLWDGIVQSDDAILKVLADNSEKAHNLKTRLLLNPTTSLEVGVGPLGLGISAFLQEIPFRFAIDPLSPVSLDFPLDSQPRSSQELRTYLLRSRENIKYVVASGEQLPFPSEIMDLVICCNVIDHASDPQAILREIHRLLKPNGIFFFDVDTFSLLGLAKWHTRTKYTHKDEILVTTHPHRMYESGVFRNLKSCGFKLQKVYGHSLLGNLIGHACKSGFLASKCSP